MNFEPSVIFGTDDQLMKNLTTVFAAFGHFDVDFCLTGARFLYPESKVPEEFILFVSTIAPRHLIIRHLISQSHFCAVEGNPHCLLSQLGTSTPFITILPLRDSRDFEEEQSTFGVGLERLTGIGAGAVFRGEATMCRPIQQWNAVSIPELVALKLLAWSGNVGDRLQQARDICRLLPHYIFLENEAVLDTFPDIFFGEQEVPNLDMLHHLTLKHWVYWLGVQIQSAITQYNDEHQSTQQTLAAVKAAADSTELAKVMSKFCLEEYQRYREILVSFVEGMDSPDLPF